MDALSAEDLLEQYLVRRELGSAEPEAEFLARHEPVRERLQALLCQVARADAALAAAAAPELPLRRAGPYRIEAELGRGGMGIVYAAVRERDGAQVALKLLPSRRAASPCARARFRREVDALAALDHPGIVRVLDSGMAGDAPWFAMERLPGPSLDRVVADCKAARGELPISRALLPVAVVRRHVALLAGVADALEHAHRAGVLHRDVKPSNIVLRADDSPVLTDFGLARASGAATLTETGDLTGTPHYLAPEQALLGRLPQDGRADIWSLGATLYELLTLTPPFAGSSTAEVLTRLATEECPDPRARNPGLEKPLAAIVLKALARDPAERYASAAELAADLRAYLGRRRVRARMPDRLLRAARRQPAAAALLLVLLVGVPLAVGAAAYLAPRVAAARGAARFDRREERLAAACDALLRGDDAAAREAAAAAAADGADEAEVRAVLALAAGDGVDEALEGSFRDLVVAVAMVRSAVPAEGTLRAAFERLDLAFLAAPQARLVDHVARARLAVLAGAAEAAGETALALAVLWPESDVARSAAAAARASAARRAQGAKP